jgi:hypothetical protein
MAELDALDDDLKVPKHELAFDGVGLKLHSIFSKVPAKDAAAAEMELRAMANASCDPLVAPMPTDVVSATSYMAAEAIQECFDTAHATASAAGWTADQVRERITRLISGARQFNEDYRALLARRAAGIIERAATLDEAGREMRAEVPKPRPFLPQRFHEFADEPAPEYDIDGLVPERSTNLWIGTTGHFKSTVALGAAVAMASGLPAFGTFKTNRTGAVAWIAGEDVASIGPRIKALEKEHDRELRDMPFFRIASMVKSGDVAQLAELIAELEAVKPPEGFALIVIDTLSTSVRGQDENSNATMSVFVGMLGELRNHFGCSVIALHHRPKSAGKGEANARGGGAAVADVDAVLLIERDEKSETPLVNITVSKLRLAQAGGKHTLVGKVHQIGRRKDSTPVTAVALVHDEETGAAIRQKVAAKRSLTETILYVLDEMAGHGIEFCDTRTLYLAIARSGTWLNGNYAAYTKATHDPMTEAELAAWPGQRKALTRLIADTATRKKNFNSTRIASKSQTEREWTWYPNVAGEILAAKEGDGEVGQ